jgi:septum formation protein
MGAARRAPRAAVPEIVLASASPRRAALLRQIGLPFRVQASALDEEEVGTQAPGEPPEEMARRLALAKAREVAGGLAGGLVVGADTMVVADGLPFGKPRSPAEAQAIWSACPGGPIT